MSEWQTIESAPYDGTEFLATGFAETLRSYWIVFWNGHDFESVDSGDLIGPLDFWMPLLAPPSNPMTLERGPAMNESNE